MEINDKSLGFTDSDIKEVSFRDIFFQYFQYWKWFIASMALFLALGVAYIKLATPEYKIDASLLIKDNKGNLDGKSDLLKDLDLFSSDKVIDNEIQILKSNSLIKKALSALNLQTSYFATARVRRHEIYGNSPYNIHLLKASSNINYEYIYKAHLVNSQEIEINGKKYPLNKAFNLNGNLIFVTANQNNSKNYSEGGLEFKFNNIDALAEQYENDINITPFSKQGTVIIITLESPIPKKGEDILNRLIFEYNEAAVDDKNKTTAATLSFITDRLNKLQEELGVAEKKVEVFKSGNKITDISTQSQVFLQTVQSNDAELGRVKIQLSVIKSIEEYINKPFISDTHTPPLAGINDPTLQQLIIQYGDAQIKKQTLLQTVPETNPIVKGITEQLSLLRNNIAQTIYGLKNGLLVTKNLLEKQNSSYQSIISSIPSKERGLIDVMRQQEIKNNLFTYLLQKREETEISLASTAADSRIIDAANSSRLPIKPVKSLTIVVFLFFGLCLPIAFIYVRNLFNYKVSSRNDVEKATNVPIIAEISHSNDPHPLIVVSKPRSMVSEQIRALRTNLNFIIPDKDEKVILFTSSISGEGKSFISLNLGASIALSNKKVVILELDLRKPKLHAGLEIENNYGLSNYLIGEVTKEQILKEIPQQAGYYIITSGPIPPNPAELLMNSKLNILIDELKEEFDYILLDAPPVGLVTDAQIMGAMADTTIFVIRHDYTAKSYIQAINNFYRNNKFKNMNLIINSVQSSGRYGYGYSYGYGYGYGGYYSDESAN